MKSHLTNQPIDNDEVLPLTPGKNKDLKEVSFETANGHTVKMAQAYGFRNIQNIMRKIKTGKCEYVYVELMACPSGCVNGGGQIKLKEVNDTRSEKLADNQELIKQIELYLNQEGPRTLFPTGSKQFSAHESLIKQTVKELQEMQLEDSVWHAQTFKAIPKQQNPLNIKW